MKNTKRTLLAGALLAAASSPALGQHWAETNAWHFGNFPTDELTWEQYRETFIGVPPERDYASSAFDVLFYDYLYKDQLSVDGNCYGIALLNLLVLQNGGHHGVCGPPSGFTASHPELELVINRMHGHQVNLPSLRFYLDAVAASKNRDGGYAFDQVNYYQALEDPTLISITKSLNPSEGGHSMVAYGTEVASGQKRILIYDPNRPYPSNTSYYDNGENVVLIGSGGSWEFEMSGGTPWSGSPSSGGNILITPISVAAPPSRLPTSLGLNALDLINTIFVSAESELVQVTDGEGKRLFVPGTREIDSDPATGMLSAVPLYVSAAGAERGPRNAAYVFLRDPGASLDLEVSPGSDGYEVCLAGRGGIARVRAEADPGSPGGRDRLRLARGPAGGRSLVLANALGAREYEVELTAPDRGRGAARTFRLTRLRSARDSAVRLELGSGAESIAVSGATAPVSCELELGTEGGGARVASPRRPLRIEPGRGLRVRPRDWADPAGLEPVVEDR